MTELLAVTDMIQGEDQGCFGLTQSEKIIGFGITALCGIVAGILSIVGLFMLNLRKFTVLFSLSTVLFNISLSLLVGCKKLCGAYFNKKRMYASIAMFVSIIVVLYFGAVKKMWILPIIGFIVEFLSFLYFALSFIPGGEALFHWAIF